MTEDARTFDNACGSLANVTNLLREEFSESKCSAIAEAADTVARTPDELMPALCCLTAFQACATPDALEQKQTAVKLAAAMQALDMGLTIHENAFNDSYEQVDKDATYLIVLGDYLYSLAYQLICELKNTELMSLTADTVASVTAAALACEVNQQHDTRAAKQTAFRSYLYALCCGSAGILTNASQNTKAELSRIGTELGKAHDAVISNRPEKDITAHIRRARDAVNANKEILRIEPFYGLIDFIKSLAQQAQ
ncbi:hypothetical protein STSP2_00893 [Anaerohalosphaera lusitana]|uniref:Geranylgeranyl pyrophosphate synthase n=1 Tax=Anaerohalosphaera lusitana TaxID=1936003 RepID=A0A1U9NJ40_9BACT|nr:polyprenyl synthetase family protein [Anaerohalosphaera lusitana]AQT67744.1 hypothetical protein STSP2_00893 [Anaerohalosphaera lusitana]